MNPAADVWSKVITLMQPDMTATTINTWFDDASAVALEDDRFVLYSPTRFKRDIIATRYVGKIQAALRELFSCDMDVVVLTEGELDQYSQPEKDNFFPGTEEYTFERFVVGSSNKFAHAAARAVADNPGKSYNPLFIYGESGLGKTHLLYAIAHTIHKNHPEYKVVYIKGDTFTNELIQAIREGRNAEFREKYRGADVFLMDDVQFIAGRDSTQEEMFHTFNTLYETRPSAWGWSCLSASSSSSRRTSPPTCGRSRAPSTRSWPTSSSWGTRWTRTPSSGQSRTCSRRSPTLCPPPT